MKQKVLITGANGGFGNLMVEELLKNGHQVVASMRNIEKRNKTPAEKLKIQGAKIIEMDVADDQSVSRGISDAIKQVGDLNVVVNNAGLGVIGFQETFTADDWKKLFDVNVFGIQRVLREIVPSFRKQKDGLIINISSLLGRITVPFYGAYNASKWAVEAMTENYRTELSKFGIDVCIIEPGGFPTTFIDNLMRGSDLSRNESYREIEPTPESFLKGFEEALANNPAQDPRNVAKATVEIIETPKGERAFRTIVDKMGMGDPITSYNESLHQMTQGIYSAFGIDHFLKIK